MTADIRGALTARALRAGSPVQLSGMDTSFLLHERRGAHMHIGAVAVFDGPAPSREELREHLAERLRSVPRFRQKLAHPPLGLSRPWWVDDPQFNLDYHLRQIALPPLGDAEDLRSLIARVFSQRLDRKKPLWEMYFAEGLDRGRFALIIKAHHALVDGISAVDLAGVIMDTAPQPVTSQGAGVPFECDPPSRAELAVRSIVRDMRAPVRLAGCAAEAMLYPRQVPRRFAKVAATVGSLGRELLEGTPSVPLNADIGTHRRYDYRDLELARIHAVKRHYEATVNDVVLAIATGALRGWLRGRNVRTEGLQLRALVPVNLRRKHERGLLGNRVGLLRVALPVNVEEPEQQLLLIRNQMGELKRSRQLMGAETILGLLDFAPPTLLAQASALNFPARLFNLIITNVPGPQFPLYLLGRALESVAPIAFLPAGHALSIAAVSYNGLVSFGLLGDHDKLYDLEVLAEGLEDSLRELAQDVGPAPRSVAGRLPDR